MFLVTGCDTTQLLGDDNRACPGEFALFPCEDLHWHDGSCDTGVLLKDRRCRVERRQDGHPLEE